MFVTLSWQYRSWRLVRRLGPKPRMQRQRPSLPTAVTTPEVTPTLIPKSGDLIFLEFFAIT
ncbi:MAG: hypothetical protein MZU97_07220 [Bacillus subtilis]|nr:hypothetical protein [Bacillus subtilis]